MAHGRAKIRVEFSNLGGKTGTSRPRNRNERFAGELGIDLYT